MQIFAVLMVLLATLTSVLGMCPMGCTCHNQMALCTGRSFRGLEYYTGLKELTLISTGLRSLGSSVFPEMLIKLNVRHNLMLTTIEKTAFINLDGLKHLQISHNPDLTSIPFSLFFNNPKLIILDLSFNNLDSIHYSTLMHLKNLIELRLQGNRFTTFHGAVFSQLMNLKILQLDYNRIESIPPNLFSATFNLEELYLNNNNLVSLDERLFSSMTELRVLDLSYNFLSTLPEKLFLSQRYLRQLSLSWNYFDTVPSLISTLDRLEELKLNGNELCHLSTEIFTPLKNLHFINVSANYLLECNSNLKVFLDWCHEKDVKISPNASCRYLSTRVTVSLDTFYDKNSIQVSYICILLIIVILLVLRLAMDVFVDLYFAQRSKESFYPLISSFRASMANRKPLNHSKTPPLVSYRQDEEGGAVDEPEYEYIDMHHVSSISVKNMNYYEVPLPQPQKSVNTSPPISVPRCKAPSPPVYSNFN